jgi:hypothetical protein
MAFSAILPSFDSFVGIVDIGEAMAEERHPIRKLLVTSIVSGLVGGATYLLVIFGLVAFMQGPRDPVIQKMVEEDRLVEIHRIPNGARDVSILRGRDGWHTFKMDVGGRERMFLRRYNPYSRLADSEVLVELR